MGPAMSDSTLSSAAMLQVDFGRRHQRSSRHVKRVGQRASGKLGKYFAGIRDKNRKIGCNRWTVLAMRVFLQLRRIVDHVCARAWYAAKKTCEESRSLQHVLMTDF